MTAHAQKTVLDRIEGDGGAAFVEVTDSGEVHATSPTRVLLVSGDRSFEVGASGITALGGIIINALDGHQIALGDGGEITLSGSYVQIFGPGQETFFVMDADGLHHTGAKIGFHGSVPVVRADAPTTMRDVAQALMDLGLIGTGPLPPNGDIVIDEEHSTMALPVPHAWFFNIADADPETAMIYLQIQTAPEDGSTGGDVVLTNGLNASVEVTPDGQILLRGVASKMSNQDQTQYVQVDDSGVNIAGLSVLLVSGTSQLDVTTDGVYIANGGDPAIGISFFGVSPSTQHSTPASLADVVQMLIDYGLVEDGALPPDGGGGGGDTLEAPHFIGDDGEPDFQNGVYNWDTANPGSGRARVSYYLDRGRVYLDGLMGFIPDDTVAFTLPLGYRPSDHIMAYAAEWSVWPNGDVQFHTALPGNGWNNLQFSFLVNND